MNRLVVDVRPAQSRRIDWDRAREAGLEAVWLKATEGVGWPSPSHPIHEAIVVEARRIEDAGLPLGLYHYARPDLIAPHPVATADEVVRRASREAAWALETHARVRSAGCTLALRLALDLEEGLPSTSRGKPRTRSDAELSRFAMLFERMVVHATGRPMLYANGRYLRALADAARQTDLWLLKRMPLWYAGDRPNPPPGWGPVALWQTPERRVPWYSKRIDVNYCADLAPLERP
jgi:GH25 family lysozyme M1 (1,4-beta-N-acetylmuramidase)